MGTVKGNEIMFFTVSGSTKTPIAYCTSVKISQTNSTNKLITKDSDGAWESSTSNMLSYTVDMESAYAYVVSGSNGAIQMEKMFQAQLPIDFIIGEKSGSTPAWTLNETVVYKQGKLLLTKFDQTYGADNTDATYSISGTGIGPLEIIEV